MLDVARLLEDLGGPTRVTRELRAMGYALSRATAHAWTYRSSLPSRWLSPLVQLAARDGKPLRLEDYLTK